MKKRNTTRKNTKSNNYDTNLIHVYSIDKNISPKEEPRQTYSHLHQTFHESIKKIQAQRKKY